MDQTDYNSLLMFADRISPPGSITGTGANELGICRDWIQSQHGRISVSSKELAGMSRMVKGLLSANPELRRQAKAK